MQKNNSAGSLTDAIALATKSVDFYQAVDKDRGIKTSNDLVDAFDNNITTIRKSKDADDVAGVNIARKMLRATFRVLTNKK